VPTRSRTFADGAVGRLPSDGGVGRAAGKKINVRTFDELRRLYAEPRHEFMGFAHADFGRLVFSKHDLELEEVPQASDSVKMDAGSSDKEHRAVLLHPARLAVR